MNAASLILPAAETPIAEAALMYALVGMAPIPLYGLNAACECSCPSGAECPPRNRGKHPIGRDWQKRATLDLDEIRDRFREHRGNLGIYLALGGYVLIDADGELGLATAASWELPPTFSQRSGSGQGGHAVYQLAPHQDGAAITDRRVADGLDVKVRGQFVAAPSRHASGQQYGITHAVRPTALPDALYERLVRRVPAVRTPAPSADAPSDLLRRARAYVATIPPGISGSGGHDQTFAAARALAGWIDRGLSQADAWSLLVEYNARCQPPWSERELEHKWKSASAAHTPLRIEDRPRPALRAIAGGRSTSMATEPGDTGGATSAPGAPPGGPGAEPDWRAELLWKESKSGASTLVSHVENVIRILQLAPEWRGKVQFDEFASRVHVTEPPWDDYQRPSTASTAWTDEDGTRLCGWLRRKFHRYAFCPSVTDCDRGVDVAARRYGFHPVRQYLEALEWDGVSRLGTWLPELLGAERSTYTSMVGRWWLISAVARIFRPGVMVRTVPILEGAQELKKSSAIRVLAGDAWFNDTPIDLNSKDAYQAIQGYWFVELAELDSLMRAESSRAKAFFSSGIDRYRPPYGRRVVESPRQCVFVGTVNPPYEYLDDPSGGTRYWPIRCSRIDLERLAELRDQLWAEAVYDFREGALWYPIADGERAVLGDQQDDREKQDAWTATISAYLRRSLSQRTTLEALLQSALHIDPKDWTKAAQTRLGIVMTKLGWLKVRRREGDRRWYEYEAAQPQGPNQVEP